MLISENYFWSVSKRVPCFSSQIVLFLLGSLLETQMFSFPTRSSFQRMSSIVLSKRTCVQIPTMNNQKHIWMQDWRDLQTSQVQYLLQAGLTSKLEQAAQGFIQACYENLQGWRLPILSWQPVVVCRHPCGGEFLPFIHLKLLVFQYVSIISVPFFVHLRKVWPHFLYNTPFGRRRQQLSPVKTFASLT